MWRDAGASTATTPCFRRWHLVTRKGRFDSDTRSSYNPAIGRGPLRLGIKIAILDVRIRVCVA